MLNEAHPSFYVVSPAEVVPLPPLGQGKEMGDQERLVTTNATPVQATDGADYGATKYPIQQQAPGKLHGCTVAAHKHGRARLRIKSR